VSAWATTVLNDAYLVCAIWGVGLIAQALLSLRERLTIDDAAKILWMALGSGVIGFLPFRHENGYHPHQHTIAAFTVFVFAFAAAYMKWLMPVVSEHMLLVWNILFLATIVPLLGPASPWFYPLLVPSASTLVLAFTPGRIPFALKAAFYVWFLTILVGLGVAQFTTGALSAFFDESTRIRLSPADAFVSGMAFMSIGIYAVFLVLLIPIPGKHQSWDDRMREWHLETDLMVRHFDDDNQRVTTTLVILVLLGGLIAAQARWALVSPLMFLNLAIVVTPPALRLLSPSHRALAGERQCELAP
jgi:hypothetical protein